MKNVFLLNNGDAGFTLQFSTPTSEHLTRSILCLKDALAEAFSDRIVDVIPAYQSLTLTFRLWQEDRVKLANDILLFSQKFQPDGMQQPIGKLVEIPVCYEKELAPDIEFVAKHCGCTVEEVIMRHTAPTYLVNMLGFLPGFFYLSGLDQKLNCPRKNVPRLQVAEGAVGIGGTQTGIYPVDSPGGWQLIGRTPIKTFNPKLSSPFIVCPLDQVKFVPIDLISYKQIKKEGWEKQ